MSGSRGKCRCGRLAPRFKRRREPRRRFRRMPEPNNRDRCSREYRLVRFLDRKIAARLPTLYPRRVEWRMIPDYRAFTIGSMFKGTDQSPARSALLTANWRGCEQQLSQLQLVQCILKFRRCFGHCITGGRPMAGLAPATRVGMPLKEFVDLLVAASKR